MEMKTTEVKVGDRKYNVTTFKIGEGETIQWSEFYEYAKQIPNLAGDSDADYFQDNEKDLVEKFAASNFIFLGDFNEAEESALYLLALGGFWQEERIDIADETFMKYDVIVSLPEDKS